MPTTYLFYVDESGQREYGPNISRYFALAALAVPVESWQLINTQVHALKQSYFGDPTVEIKSSWLRDPRAAEKRYLTPYPVSPEALHECVHRLYEIVDHPSLTLFATVIDKVQMQEVYPTPHDPSSLAYRLLFERLQQYLVNEGGKSYGIVVFDRIHDADFREKGYENLLANQHLRYLQKGTDFVEVSNIVEGLLFISSTVNNFIQLADLCAYNIYRQFKDHGEQWDRPNVERLPLYAHFRRVLPKLHRTSSGLVSGFGIKKYPDWSRLGLPRIDWVLARDATGDCNLVSRRSNRVREGDGLYQW